MLIPSDLLQIKAKNLTEDQINEQLSFLRKGFPFQEIISSASVEKGILQLSEEQQDFYIQSWDKYKNGNKQITKFVPASGAASRMFKDLYAFLSSPYDTPTTDFEKTFFEGIQRFAFYKALNDCCIANEGKTITELMDGGSYKTIVSNLLEKKGLNYGSLPKGLLLFHNYPDGPRTAFEEHIVEGFMYAKQKKRGVHLHFTILKEHEPLFDIITREKLSVYGDKYNCVITIEYSMQEPDTDTIAADMANAPLRDRNGRLVFRPGGHGALLKNLNSIDADVVFVKNIDNVVPDSFKGAMLRYKKVIAGLLVAYQKRIFNYVRLIEKGKYTHQQIEEMIYFLQNDLCIKNPDTKYLEDVELILYIKRKLMRPFRICAMVKNEGEPGGGPFLAVNPDGTVSPQILESQQLNMKNPEVRKLFERSSFFNPVDMVCALKDVHGKKYNLAHFVNKNAGLITIKSKDGRDLKALELPGLWNGSMSDWNTLFVEVPIETFNPVKTVNDLLRPQHQ